MLNIHWQTVQYIHVEKVSASNNGIFPPQFFLIFSLDTMNNDNDLIFHLFVVAVYKVRNLEVKKDFFKAKKLLIHKNANLSNSSSASSKATGIVTTCIAFSPTC